MLNMISNLFYIMEKWEYKIISIGENDCTWTWNYFLIHSYNIFVVILIMQIWYAEMKNKKDFEMLKLLNFERKMKWKICFVHEK